MLFNFNNAQISAMYLDVCGQKLPKARHMTIRVQIEIIIAFGTLIFTLRYLFFFKFKNRFGIQVGLFSS